MAHLPLPFRFLIVAATTVVATSAHAGLVDDLVRSRERIKPFRAVYRETVRVLKRKEAKEGMPGWGMVNSVQKVQAGIDKDSSYRNSEFLAKGVTGEDVFTAPGKTYSMIDGGMRGNFGKRPDGTFNPAAAAYELIGYPVNRYFEEFSNYEERPNGVIRVNDGDYQEELLTNRFGDQTVIESKRETKPGAVSVRWQITEWTEFEGSRFPKAAVHEVLRGGEVATRTQYELVKVLSDPAALAFKFREGAHVRDMDTNISYDVKGGQLVEDPVSSAARKEAQRQRIFFAIAGAAGLTSLGYLLWRRGRRKVGPPAS